MAKKITISVPDELHEKMQEWKGSINFSRIFQEAISNLIQKKKDFKKRLKEDPDMEAILERLKAEKHEFENEFFETGKGDGLLFAKSASYDELRYALGWKTIREINKAFTSYDPTRDEILGEYFDGIFKEYDLIDFEDTTGENCVPNCFFAQWEAGWKEGIEEFWNEIKDKL